MTLCRFAFLLVVACHSPEASNDAMPPVTPVTPVTASVDAAVTGVIDSSVAPPDVPDATAPLDATLREALAKCLGEQVGMRLGYRGIFFIHVEIDVDDSGTAHVTTSEPSQAPRAARPDSCLEKFGAQFAAAFPGRHRHSYAARGPGGGWHFTPE